MDLANFIIHVVWAYMQFASKFPDKSVRLIEIRITHCQNFSKFRNSQLVEVPWQDHIASSRIQAAQLDRDLLWLSITYKFKQSGEELQFIQPKKYQEVVAAEQK